MPHKPKQGCAYPNCPKLTNWRYCEEHQRLDAKQYNRFTRAVDVNKKYGRAWKKIRDHYVQAHPLCEQCLKQGRTTPALTVTIPFILTSRYYLMPITSQRSCTKMTDNLVQLRTCPRCGGVYSGHGAVSRADNLTVICPDCGTREVLRSIGVDEKEQEKILDIIHNF